MARDDAIMLSRMKRILWENGVDNANLDPVARRLVAVVRREEQPDLQTWVSGDPQPEPSPQRVSDLNGRIWEIADDGHGCYRLVTMEQRVVVDAPLRPWRDVLDFEGPLTEVR